MVIKDIIPSIGASASANARWRRTNTKSNKSKNIARITRFPHQITGFPRRYIFCFPPEKN